MKPEDSEKMVIHIDPGTAFGTGMHETTQLCIRQIRKYVKPDTRILDVGCGSGILGMLALKFGAAYSVGTDLDPCAIDATRENMAVNGIPQDKYEVMIGNIIDDRDVQDKVGYECYDIVAANILADVLVELTPVIVHQLKKGGIYITSGIIDDKEDTVVKAVQDAGVGVPGCDIPGRVGVCETARQKLMQNFFIETSPAEDGIIRLSGADVNIVERLPRKAVEGPAQLAGVGVVLQQRCQHLAGRSLVGSRVQVDGRDASHIEQARRLKLGALAQEGGTVHRQRHGSGGVVQDQLVRAVCVGADQVVADQHLAHQLLLDMQQY